MTKKLTIVSMAILLLAAIMATVFLLQPSPYKGEIDDTVGKIPSDAFNLIIYTDIHHDPVYTVDPYQETINCIGEILKRSRIDSIWNLGDIINGHTTTKSEAIAQIREVIGLEDKTSPNFHRIQGNHDNNSQATYSSNAGYPASETLSVDEMNAVLENTVTSQTEYHNPSCSTDYYVDFPQLRVVCLSANEVAFRQETADWLRRTALKTEKPILFLSHIPTRPEWGFHNDVQGGEIIERVIKDFISAGGNVIAYIHGHDHGDMINTVSDEDGSILWSEVCVGCARFHVPSSNGTPGMIFRERNEKDETRLLFDIVSIDLEKKIVSFTRFGAGEDRMIEY